MGVINVTPDSFSDGGTYQNKNLKSLKFDILDFGAESTAPFNKAISASEEQTRLKNFFSPIANKWVSLDSYKLETMKWFKEEFPSQKTIFNDISGQLEDEYLEFLQGQDSYFVFSHNLVPTRQESSSHMKFTQDSLDFYAYFDQALEKIDQRGLLDKVILDPCFGFAKTREQNISLLKKLPELVKRFNSDIPWLIGISRKSFLRNPPNLNPKKEEFKRKLDQIGSTIMASLIKDLKGRKVIFRTHEEESFHLALESSQYL